MTNQNPVYKLLTIGLVGAAITTALAAPQTHRVASNAPATVEFNFRVTLIPVPGKVNSLSAKLVFDPKNLSKTSGSVSVNLAKLETGIGLRDEHAKGYLGADKHPNVIFTLSRIDGVKVLENGKESKGNAVGSFDLNGIKKPLVAPIVLKPDGGKVQVSTKFDVVLADHNISIPGADANVDVKVNFALEPSN